ncbi:hypothetical protein GCM10012275_28250 [Longimycelium tulufanense]|uniref:Uncharacterized protein n=1 Tax=Longimycelium tulufanense TaxID=907463 RepID=A0A8J3C8L3_9PSEU|nr:hypothetical protein [Longimycelium tulufanense]GGM55482.1 hypothetical protein GCM10012275_28250 [Longimycelium tulufanense]
MGKFILTDVFVEVNGVNFSDHVSSVEVSVSHDEVDVTSFSGGGRERLAGLRDDSFTLNFQQDFAVGEVDATLWPLFSNKTEFTVKVRGTSAAISTSNPEYSATCILLEYQALSGSPGDLSETSVTFPAQRSGIARATV